MRRSIESEKKKGEKLRILSCEFRTTGDLARVFFSSTYTPDRMHQSYSSTTYPGKASHKYPRTRRHQHGPREQTETMVRAVFGISFSLRDVGPSIVRILELRQRAQKINMVKNIRNTVSNPRSQSRL